MARASKQAISRMRLALRVPLERYKAGGNETMRQRLCEPWRADDGRHFPYRRAGGGERHAQPVRFRFRCRHHHDPQDAARTARRADSEQGGPLEEDRQLGFSGSPGRPAYDQPSDAVVVAFARTPWPRRRARYVREGFAVEKAG
jgi:hypothetical protein